MESDSFFFQFFKQLPGSFFELIDAPPDLAAAYRFDSVEIAKR